MAELQELIRWLLVILPLGVAARIIYCLCCIPTDSENEATNKRRIRNTLIFFVLAETIAGLLSIIANYIQ